MNELTTLETEMLEKYTDIPECLDKNGECPEEYEVFLDVGVQRFVIGRTASEDIEQAEWMRKMLAKALAAIVTEQRGLDDCRSLLMRRRSDELMLYVAVDPKQPHAAYAACLDDPRWSQSTAMNIARWEQEGAKVMRVTHGVARTMMYNFVPIRGK